MSFAVILYFDPNTEERVQQVWELLAQAGLNQTMVQSSLRPHITLAGYECIDDGLFHTRLEAYAQGTAGISLAFVSVSVFPGKEGVVFFAPLVTPALLELHARFHALMDAAGEISKSYYLPGKWVPHCTVSLYTPPAQIAPVVELCVGCDIFQPGGIEAIALYDITNAKVLVEYTLAG